MKSIKGILLAITIVLLLPAYVKASTGTISVSSNKATEGEQVTAVVSIKGSEAIGALEFYLNYDDSILEYVSGASGGGAGRLKFIANADSSSISYTITFKAKGVGKSTLRLSDCKIGRAHV